ncbi:hypothetical protein [Amycolatopsis sp. NPDC049868]|uniref:hypothetical protein n=1 Tax=Amycolatopsis sp. NPDC049868 TaxID=3363934 RepID=UPI0037890822
MVFSTDRVTCHVSSSLDAAQTTKATGTAARDTTDLMYVRAQGFNEEGAQGLYGGAVMEADRRNRRLANEQWDGHDQMSCAVSNGVHRLKDACDQSIVRLGNTV